ncbi:MAG: hypothetical protein M3383_03025 [Actinomycetota bacterium]|nr:hypothetical protein [Actinomycetota bacterium]
MDPYSKPAARSKDLIVERLDDEVLVYDKARDRGHCLSPEAALVWDRCDGRTPRDGLSAQLGLDAETIDRALFELDSCDLLEAGSTSGGSTRRELSVKLVKTGAAAAIAAPMIMSVTAPTPAQAVTLAFCRSISTTSGCGACQQAGCCCCEPANTNIKDCVPDSATCCSIYGAGANRSSGCQPAGPCRSSSSRESTNMESEATQTTDPATPNTETPTTPQPTPAPDPTTPAPAPTPTPTPEPTPTPDPASTTTTP